jgi:polyhydroxybutyrate depolymerase
MSLACAAILLFSVACVGGSSSKPTLAVTIPPATPEPAACSPAKPQSSGDSGASISSGGLDRGYTLHVPAGYDGARRVPLLLLFHGFSLDAAFMASYVAFPRVSDASGAVVVSLDGTGEPKRWNAVAAATGPDDLAFAKELLDRIMTDFCIDPARVFAVGFSNGGGMAQRVSCDLPGRIAAVGVVAAAYVNCQGTTPVIAFHGIADPIVAFEGGENPPEQGGGVFPPVRRSVSEWARSLGCEGLAVISRPSANVELSTYRNCRLGDGEALLYAIIGGGHTWPGATMDLPPQIVGATTHEIDATATIWEFLQRHPLTQ